MNYLFSHFRSFLTAVLALALAWGISAISQASLILPPLQGFDFETDLSASEAGGASTNDAQIPAEDPLAIPDNDFTELLIAKFAAKKANVPSGTSSSSSSIGGATSSLLLCLAADSIVAGDDPLVGRLALELQLFLPDAPGTELFHPPQNRS